MVLELIINLVDLQQWISRIYYNDTNNKVDKTDYTLGVGVHYIAAGIIMCRFDNNIFKNRCARGVCAVDEISLSANKKGFFNYFSMIPGRLRGQQ